jgi:hypothetical protein
VIRRAEDIDHLQPPRCRSVAGLRRVLDCDRRAQGSGWPTRVPIIGVAISPFSLPVMQMGFDRYLELMHEQPQRFLKLMQVNEDFTVAWANAQLAAGATAICYFDPVSSTTNIPRSLYLRDRTAGGEADAGTHQGADRHPPRLRVAACRSSATLPIPAPPWSASASSKTWRSSRPQPAGRVSLLGNLNGIEMRRWTPRAGRARGKARDRPGRPGRRFHPVRQPRRDPLPGPRRDPAGHPRSRRPLGPLSAATGSATGIDPVTAWNAPCRPDRHPLLSQLPARSQRGGCRRRLDRCRRRGFPGTLRAPAAGLGRTAPACCRRSAHRSWSSAAPASARLGDAPAGFPPLRLLRQQQCFHIVASPALVDQAIADGAYLLTPAGSPTGAVAWPRWASSRETAGEFFKDFAQRLLLLDTGIDPESATRLDELAQTPSACPRSACRWASTTPACCWRKPCWRLASTWSAPSGRRSSGSIGANLPITHRAWTCCAQLARTAK